MSLDGYDVTITAADPTPAVVGLDQAVLSPSTSWLTKFSRGFADFAEIDGYAFDFTAVDSATGVELTVQLIADDWAASTVNGLAPPGLTGTPATLGPIDVAAGDRISVAIPDLMQTVADSSVAWHGIQIDRVDAGADLTVWGFNAADPTVRPSTDVTASEAQPEPSRLSPGGGRYVSVRQPLIRVLDYAVSLDDQTLSDMRLQWSTDPDDFTSPAADDTLTVTGPEFPTWLAASGFQLPVNMADTSEPGPIRYYRTQLKVNGIWGPWSPVESTGYAPLGDGTFDFDDHSPTSTDPDPPRTWSTGAYNTQTAYRLTRTRLEDPTVALNSDDTAEAPLVPSATEGGTAGYEVLDYRTYVDTVQRWDDVDREAIPGAPDYVVASTEWSLADDASVQPPETGDPRLLGGATPFPVIPWISASKDDDFRIRRREISAGRQDEQNVSGLLHGADVVVGGGGEGDWQMEYVDCSAAPNTDYRYRVQRVTAHRGSAGGEAVEIVTTARWVWLVNPATAEWVRLLNADVGTWLHDEPNSTAYGPLAGDGYYRRFRGNRLAVSTTVSGEVWAVDETDGADHLVTVNTQHKRLLAMGDTDDPILLVTPHEIIEVAVGQLADTPLDDDVELPRDVSFTVWQTGPGTLTGSDFLDPGRLVETLIDFESYADGAAITTADPSGRISQVGGTVVADDAAAMHESTMGAVLKNTVGGVFVDIDVNPLGSVVVVHSKGVTALPASDKGMLRWSTSSAVYASARLGSSGSLQLRDGAGNLLDKVSSAKLAANEAHRLVGIQAWFAGVSFVKAQLFKGQNINGSTPDAEVSAFVNAADSSDRVRVGSSSTPLFDWPIDDIQIQDASDPVPIPLGPPGVLHEFSTSLTDTPTSAWVSSSVIGLDEVDMAWSTSPAMTSPTFVGVVSNNPDPDIPIFKHHLTGLPANTDISYQLADPDGVLFGDVGHFTTSPAAGGVDVTRSYIAWSCQGNSGNTTKWDVSQPAWRKMVDIATAVGLHGIISQGDTGYWGGGVSANTPKWKHVAKYRTQIQRVDLMRHVLLLAEAIWQISDHEYSPNNGDSNASSPYGPIVRTALDAYIDLFPVAAALYGDVRTPKLGRFLSKNLLPNVRAISLDFRSLERSLQAADDDATKTALGVVQMGWLLAELRRPEHLKIILSDVAWGPAGTTAALGAFAKEDKWWAYQTSQKAVAAMICNPTTGAHLLTTAGTPINVDFWGGDRHRLGYLSEANNVLADGTKCGFPVLTCSGTDKNGLASVPGEKYDQTFGANELNDNGDGPQTQVRQFMHALIRDDGAGTISRVANGWNCAPDPTILSPVIQAYAPVLEINATDTWGY